LKHLKVKYVDLIVFEYVLGLSPAYGTDLPDYRGVSEGLLGVLVQPLVDVLLDRGRVKQ